jgi:hypothetical protein
VFSRYIHTVVIQIPSVSLPTDAFILLFLSFTVFYRFSSARSIDHLIPWNSLCLPALNFVHPSFADLQAHDHPIAQGSVHPHFGD